MNATGYIIEPSWFYWLSVLDSFNTALSIIIFILIGFIVVALIVSGVAAVIIRAFNSNDGELRAIQFFVRGLKVAVPALIACTLVFIFCPDQETLITMMVAKYATYENVGLTVDALKGAVDYIIQSIQSLN